MMQSTTAIKQAYQQAMKHGALIDITDEARRVGFDTPTAISQRAWATCVDVHPETDGNNRSSRLSDLLMTLHDQLSHTPRQRTTHLCFPTVVNKSRPATDRAQLRIRRLRRPHGGGHSLAITLSDENLPDLSHTTKKPLPRHLLTELDITLSELRKVTGAAEEKSLRTLEAAYEALKAQHPFAPPAAQEHNKFALFPSPSTGRHSLAQLAAAPMPLRRQNILANLQDITDTLRTVASPHYREEVQSLQAQLHRLQAPLSQLFHVTAKLISIAANTRFPAAACRFVHPCDTLLSIYASLAIKLDAGILNDIPQDEVAELCRQLALLQSLAEEPYLDDLCYLQEQLRQLDDQPETLEALSFPQVSLSTSKR